MNLRCSTAHSQLLRPAAPRVTSVSGRGTLSSHNPPKISIRDRPSLSAKPVLSKPSKAHRSICTAATLWGDVMADPEMRFGIVISRFNSLVTKQLLDGALEEFERHGVPADNVDVVWVPGSFELPVAALTMAKTEKYEAVACIGTIIQGSTAHYDAVVSAATSGVLNAGLNSGVPVVFGVLTTDNLEQALDRAGGKVGNKGGEAAVTAIEMASVMRKIKE